MWQKWIALVVAGGFGTLARYSLSHWTHRVTGDGFPWGTLAVNAVGCFLFGLVWSLAEGKWISTEVRTVALVGFMGAFTTFSSFAFETAQLGRDGQIWHAGANLLLQNTLGLVLIFAGLLAGRAV